MAIAYIAGTAAQNNSSGATTGNINSSGGNFVGLINCHYDLIAAPAVSDSLGNSYVGLTLQSPGGGGGAVREYYCENAVVGSSHNFTTSGAASYSSIAAEVFSGVKTSSSFDAENGAASTGSVAFSPGSLTPAGSGELYITGLNVSLTGAGATPDMSFVQTAQLELIGGVSYGVCMAYKVHTSGALAPTWSWTGNAFVSTVVAAFKAAVFSAVPRSFGAICG